MTLNRLIYLDYNATTPLLPSVREAMIGSMEFVGNASSIHSYGRSIRKILEEARQTIASYFSRPASDVIFTSGATESNNLALQGFKGNVIVSAIEHDSVYEVRQDRQVCPVSQSGIVDLGVLEELLKQRQSPVLVSVMYANNETGIIQPMADVVSLARRYGAFVHCDAVQVIGKKTVDWEALGIDMISLSAHKIGGPQGVGALIVSPKISLGPLIKGGGQERFFRSGTENVLGIVGFSEAIKKVQEADWSRVRNLRKALEKEIAEISSSVCIIGQGVERLPNTVTFCGMGLKSAVQVMSFDLRGVAVSAGSACSSGKVRSSRVLRQMGLSSDLIETSLRVSMGLETTSEDIALFVEAWRQIFCTNCAQEALGEKNARV
jgi:cysteine desulfurase